MRVARASMQGTSEAVVIKREIEPEEKAAAKERQGARTDQHPGKLPESSKGDSRDKAAQATGKKARTLAKAEAVIGAAEAGPARPSCRTCTLSRFL